VSSSQQNIVLVMVDQLAARWLETAHQGVVDLPNLRALAAGGVTFTNAYTNNPVCSPARASVATGLYSQGHGVTECGYDLDPSVPTFMQGLQAAGWRTGAFGKLHFRTQIQGVYPDYRPYGFDVTHITEDARAGEWIDWVCQEHPEHYRAALATVWMTMVPELTCYGPDRRDLRAEIVDARRDFPQATGEAYALPFPEEVSQSNWITDRARDFIASTPAETPLFAQVSYVQPHNPFTPPANYLDRVAVDTIPGPAKAEWLEDPAVQYFQQRRYQTPSYQQRDWLFDRQHYFADLAHLDHELGRLIDSLKQYDRWESTTIIFTSDHGELLHDHGLLGKWERHYDTCIRVPLIMAGPGISPAVRSEMVDHTDIAPTVYQIAGLQPPALPRPRLTLPHVPERIDPLPGRSLLSIAGGGAPKTWRDAVYIQSNNNHWEASPRSWARTIRTDRWRYSSFMAQGGEQLFDLVEDPHEQRNLAGDPAWRKQRDTLREQLFELIVLEGYPSSPRGLAGIGTW
jgi:arylsulfatase A-like enzyme